jgi:2-polyprenyl-3-methyl-5-hydroxy-6-metoxy-1,4-benzoquinol methylase
MIYRTKAEFLQSCVERHQRVLDVGFIGQGTSWNSERSSHQFLKKHAAELYGVDLASDTIFSQDPTHYLQASAENFSFSGKKFDRIYAGDLIEHLPNPGLFLDRCRMHLETDGLLLLTTPNTFNLFNLAGKLTRREPVVNKDHTCYFNEPTLRRLLQKCGWTIERVDYIYTLETTYQPSLKKRLLDAIYRILSWHTDKFIETLAVAVRPITETQR